MSNVDLQIKQAIESTHRYKPAEGHPDWQMINALVDHFFATKLNLKFPSASASCSERGCFFLQVTVWLSQVPDDIMDFEEMLMPCPPMNTDGVTAWAKSSNEMSDLMQRMTQQWIKSSNEYEANRIASAKTQLENAGHDHAYIDGIISNPSKLRSFIADARQDLIAKLQDILAKKSSGDWMEVTSSKEDALLDKHSAWLSAMGDEEDSYMPNDNAVHYPSLLLDVMIVLRKHGATDKAKMLAALAQFGSGVIHILTQDSWTKSWHALSKVKDNNLKGVAIGAAVREYVTDPDRTAPCAIGTGTNKLTANHLRTPQRLMRLATLLSSKPCLYQILHQDEDDAITSLLSLDKTVQNIALLLKNSKFCNSGSADINSAYTIIWLFLLERQDLQVNITGRNDLSVPTAVAAATGMAQLGLQSLSPRPWSFREEYRKTGGRIDICKIPHKVVEPVINATVEWLHPTAGTISCDILYKLLCKRPTPSGKILAEKRRGTPSKHFKIKHVDAKAGSSASASAIVAAIKDPGVSAGAAVPTFSDPGSLTSTIEPTPGGSDPFLSAIAPASGVHPTLYSDDEEEVPAIDLFDEDVKDGKMDDQKDPEQEEVIEKGLEPPINQDSKEDEEGDPEEKKDEDEEKEEEEEEEEKEGGKKAYEPQAEPTAE